MQSSLRQSACVSQRTAYPVRAPPCRASTQSEVDAASASIQTYSRRCTLGGLASIVALASVAAQAPAALAFGSGFPGYDMNLDGRKRALQRNKREMEADRQRAAEWRANKAAAKEAKATADAK